MKLGIRALAAVAILAGVFFGLGALEPVSDASVPGLPVVSAPAGAGGAAVRSALEPIRLVSRDASRTIVLEMALAGPRTVDFEVLDLLCRPVARPIRVEPMEPGVHRLVWDGRRDTGERAPAGMYFLRVRRDAQTWARTVTLSAR